WRYLRDADALGLKLPNIRGLLRRSQVADGVVGVWPTVTWPSHTSMLTGEPPFRHGILANAGGPLDITQSYWSATKIKMPTLTQCAMAAGLITAGVNWPVTVQANLTWNLPEVYARRNGDSSDLATVDRYGTPGLVAEICAHLSLLCLSLAGRPHAHIGDALSSEEEAARSAAAAPGRTGFRGA